METKDTVSSCSVSQEQEIQRLQAKTQLSRNILSQTDCNTTLTKLITKIENAFNSEFKELVIQNTCSEKEDNNSETASSKSVKESSLNSKTKDVHAIKYKMSKAKERCMTYFRSLHSHLQVLSKEDLKGIRIEHGFKRAFMSLFGQDADTFTSIMLLNVNLLQKQLDKDDFQEDGSMAAFWVVDNQFQKFIDSQFSLDYYSQMTDKYFVEYTRIEVKHFRDTLLQHMGNVKKFVAERTRHQRQCDRRVNKRQMQTQESKIDTCKAVDVDLVVTKSCGIESEVQDDSSRSENDTDADDAYIRPIYDKEQWLRMEAQCIALELKCQNQSLKSGQHGQILNEKSNKAKLKKEIDAYETINIKLEHSVVKLLKENETLKKNYKDLYDSIKITKAKTIEQTTSLITQNADLKAQSQAKVFAIAALKNELRKSKGNSVDTKFAKTSVLEKPVLQSPRNQSVVRQPNAFKYKRPPISKPRFASQVDMKNNLSKPVTQHYLLKGREPAFAKPDHVSASSESRNSSKNMPRFSSNDMVHNHYLEEARKKTQERNRNSKSSVMHTASPQTTTKGSKPKPRSNNQTSRILLVSKSSCVTIMVVPKVDHSKNSSSFSDSKHFVCSTYHKCVFNANHDACITKLLKEVNSRKVEFSILLVLGGFLQEIYSLLAQADSESTHGSNVDIPNIHESKQNLDLSACTSINVQKEKSFDLSAGKSNNVKPDNLRVWLLEKLISQKPVYDSQDVNDRVGKSTRSLFAEYYNGENLVVSKSFAVTTTDAPIDHQQQLDSTSSTSTLATTADGNFD
ncbi:hypothetical protein Tco_0844563, partial [Tanacetum coccineum]